MKLYEFPALKAYRERKKRIKSFLPKEVRLKHSRNDLNAWVVGTFGWLLFCVVLGPWLAGKYHVLATYLVLGFGALVLISGMVMSALHYRTVRKES